MAENSGPSASVLRLVEALYGVLGHDPAFARLHRLMEVDWSEADVTVEEIGLPRLMQNQARKLWSLSQEAADDAPSDAALHTAEYNSPGHLPTGHASANADFCDLADAIRYSERHDGLARDALWWLGQLASDPLLRRRSA